MGDFFWIFFLILLIQPWFKQKMLEGNRIKMIRTLEKKRKSRVITLIHRQESMGFLGFPFFHFINIEDSEAILRAIRMTDDECEIDMILHTPGGLVLASEQIAKALLMHSGKVTVMVPHYAMSGGTLLALAADEIIMDPNAVLGPVDPQLASRPAASILRVVDAKGRENVEDGTLIEADIAQKALGQIEHHVRELLEGKMDPEVAEHITNRLSQGHYTHDYPIDVEEGRAMGLTISTEMPQEVYDLMELHPQSNMSKPSVNFIPVPYRKKNSSSRVS